MPYGGGRFRRRGQAPEHLCFRGRNSPAAPGATSGRGRCPEHVHLRGAHSPSTGGEVSGRGRGPEHMRLRGPRPGIRRDRPSGRRRGRSGEVRRHRGTHRRVLDAFARGRRRERARLPDLRLAAAIEARAGDRSRRHRRIRAGGRLELGSARLLRFRCAAHHGRRRGPLDPGRLLDD